MDEFERLKQENEALTKSIGDIASELFRFRRVLNKAISKLDAENQNKYASQFAWFTKRVDKAAENAGLHILDLSGQPYDPGMAVTPINLDEFGGDDDLFILQMMEPVIMKDDRIQKTGTVILSKIEE